MKFAYYGKNYRERRPGCKRCIRSKMAFRFGADQRKTSRPRV